MATFITKAKQSDNAQTNFNASKEITYWAEKYNMSKEEFHKLLEENNYSISRLLAAINKKAA